MAEEITLAGVYVTEYGTGGGVLHVTWRTRHSARMSGSPGTCFI
jgi:hypothetical protein